MAIHEVLDGHEPSGSGHSPPPFKRKGSPEESSLSDPPFPPRPRGREEVDHRHPHSPQYRHESPMPGSNSEDEDDDLHNYKKRKMFPSTQVGHNAGYRQHSPQPTTSSSTVGGPEVMDQVRSTLKLKQQQKAIIESRQNAQNQGHGQGYGHSLEQQQQQQQPQQQQQQQQVAGLTKLSSNPSSSSNNGSSQQPVTETNASGVSVFHGSSSFAVLGRKPAPSPKNPKNAKSLTIFAPSYSESSLSIHSAPLQPSHSHQIMGMGLHPRTSHPLRGHPHPYSQHPPASNQPLLSPRGAGPVKKPLRAPTRSSENRTSDYRTNGYVNRMEITTCHGHINVNQDGDYHAYSCVNMGRVDHACWLCQQDCTGTLPAPILSSHTGPLPSPSFYPHPSTPFHPSNPKHMFMETVSTLFDSVDSTRSLKHTLEEQIRKSAQLLQTLQASGTMIENLVRGQFKELEKGVIERFENEIEHLSARVAQLEKHQGLTPPPPPPPKNKKSTATSGANSASSSTAMTGVTFTNNNASSDAAANKSSTTVTAANDAKATTTTTTNTNSNTNAGDNISENTTSVRVNPKEALPSPPLAKDASSLSSATAMEVEETEDQPESGLAIQALQERVSTLEKKA
ncbi:hypothetical protein BGZ94_008694 [Podila epigama]|nr:hypothetical protein BGZ94_008694 [Podila epigama]